MKYDVKMLPSAEKDVEQLKKSGDKQAVKKLDKLLNELREHPTFGTGHPERLKHCLGEIWSRHISDKHRLVYEIFEDNILVEVQQAYGHYDDK
jgi:toxin YoeB